MKNLFKNLYDSVIRAAAHPRAEWGLSALSFAESCVLPFPPPDVMLAPMAVARPSKAVRFAIVTTLFSVLGGLAGYLIGYFGFHLVEPYLLEWGYMEKFELAEAWFGEWGFWAVLVAGFSPIPYKVFTIAAGALHLALLPFVLASIIGRGARFFLVSLLLAKFGPALEAKLRDYMEWIGWAMVVLLAAVIVYAAVGH